jgi:hypothetical protein
MVKEITLPSGNIAKLDYASFENVSKLRSSLANALKGISINGLENFSGTDVISFVKDIPALAENEEVKQAIFACGKACIVAGQNLTPAYFNDPEHWQDYYPLAKEIVEHNISPFLSGLKKVLPTEMSTFLSSMKR